MYNNGSPEREPQLDAFSEARAIRMGTITNGLANLAQAIPFGETPQSIEGAQVIDMQQFYNSSHPVPEFIPLEYKKSA